MKKHVFYPILLFLFASGVQAQKGNAEFFDELAKNNPGLNELVDLNITGVSLPEFLKGIGINHNLNIHVDEGVSGMIRNTFSNVPVKDVLVFVSNEYDLKVESFGNIISFRKNPPPIEIKPPKTRVIAYDSLKQNLTLDLQDDSLSVITRLLSKQTGMGILHAPALKGKQVSIFMEDKPFLSALEKMATANDMRLTSTPDGFYVFEAPETNAPTSKTGVSPDKKGKQEEAKTQVQKDDKGCIRLFESKNAPLKEVIESVTGELHRSFLLLDEVKGQCDIRVENICFEELVKLLLSNTTYAYSIRDSILIIGDQNNKSLRSSEIIKMAYRSVDEVMEVIPADLKENMEIKIFKDLNAIVVSGSRVKIESLRGFIAQIDEVVPMIVIEVLIMDVKKVAVVATGITAGLGNPPQQTEGTITPGFNMNLTSESINNLISGINGFGLINLGNVTPEFYLNLQALEENGHINIRSTPKLSTLNGHEATLKIGNTEYYLEIANNVIGSQNPQNIITQTYKSVNADLSLTIRPVVSKDQSVTLEIEVEQSDFTGRISASAPPGSVTRNFKSLVRVRNGETILLGGLEEKNNNITYSGLPGIAKIPVIRWFFGKRNADRSNSKLNIFVKPTIIY